MHKKYEKIRKMHSDAQKNIHHNHKITSKFTSPEKATHTLTYIDTYHFNSHLTGKCGLGSRHLDFDFPSQSVQPCCICHISNGRSVVRRVPSVIKRVPSVVRRISSVVRRVPSVARRVSSVVKRAPSVVRCKGVASMRQDEAIASSCFRRRQIFAHLFHEDCRYYNYKHSTQTICNIAQHFYLHSTTVCL